jgi:hypothetical protein
MNIKNAINRSGRIVLLSGLLLLLFYLLSPAQQFDVDVETLSIGKMWQHTRQCGMEALPDAEFRALCSYPGYVHGNGGNQFVNNRTWLYYMACKDEGAGEYCLMQRLRRNETRALYPITELYHIRNYNFEDPTQPQEHIWGRERAVEFVTQDNGQRNVMVEIECHKYAWGHPDFDDFILSQTVIKNIDNFTLTDVKVGWYLNMCPTRGGSNKGFTNDTEYIWLDNSVLPMALDAGEGSFVFYDETTINQRSNTVVTYDIEPGKTYGDIGDPGNIRTLGSIDNRLYSPQVVAYAIVDCTPLKDGSKKALYNIISAENDANDWSYKSGGVPSGEFFRYDTGADYGFYDEHMSYIGAKDNFQVRKSYDELNANLGNNVNSAGTLKPWDGSHFERSPFFFITAGPWDLAPGDSAEVWTFLIGGDMDRKVSMRGGLTAVEKIADPTNHASIEDLKKNWQNAWELYSAAKATNFTNFNAGIEWYPPPAPGNVPQMNLGDELEVEPFAEFTEAGPRSAFRLKWLPVHQNYTDPLKGTNDIAKYVVYKSVIDIEGPWDVVTEVPVSEAVVESGRVVKEIEGKPNLPTRFLVTAVDTDGHESDRRAYTYFPYTAPSPSTDKLSEIKVVPNPFRQISRLLDPGEEKRLTFVNIPASCTIRIYTMAGDLVKTLEHEGYGSTAWGSSQGNDYMLTDFGHNVMPGVYIYHVENHSPGHEGETHVGKFAIIK